MYMVFKFLHVVGASAWVGGVIVITLLDALLASAAPEARGPMARQVARMRRIVLGPSAMLTLIFGIAATVVSGIGFPFWIAWGLAAIAVTIAVGATFGRRLDLMLSSLAEEPASNERHYAALQRRLVAVDLAIVLTMLSTVAMMVFKPAW